MNQKRVFIIAEAGVNHNGDLHLARKLIDAAVQAGADAVKFQTFNAKLLASPSAPKALYQQERTDKAQSQQNMLASLELPHEWHEELMQYAEHRGIQFLSTPFDVGSLQFLVDLGVSTLKVPSGELTNAPLIWKFAQTQKPLIVSTGMATLSEVEQCLAVIAHALEYSEEPASIDEVWRAWSVSSIRSKLEGHVILLHCTSQYPTPPNEVNLLAIDTLAKAFGLPVGYSDHTEGTLIPIAAVARGAVLIEKHLTLDRALKGPDHHASLEPEELKKMVQDIRSLELAMGTGHKSPQPSEWNTRLAARQQVIAAVDITEGSCYRREDLTTARCGGGLEPARLWQIVGTKAKRSIKAGEPIVDNLYL